MNDRLTLVTRAVSAAQLCDHSQDEHDGRAPPDQPGRHHPPRTLATDNAISGYVTTSKTCGMFSVPETERERICQEKSLDLNKNLSWKVCPRKMEVSPSDREWRDGP